jgi:Phospholipase_D-nuclease N-terminal
MVGQQHGTRGEGLVDGRRNRVDSEQHPADRFVRIAAHQTHRVPRLGPGRVEPPVQDAAQIGELRHAREPIAVATGQYRGRAPYRSTAGGRMLLFDGMGGLLVLALWIFSFIDVLLTPEGACRNLPKLAWVFLVLLLPLLGSIAWLVAGRPWNRVPGGARPFANQRASRSAPNNPDDDEEFLAGLRLRAEEQRRRAGEQQSRDQHDGPDAG